MSNRTRERRSAISCLDGNSSVYAFPPNTRQHSPRTTGSMKSCNSSFSAMANSSLAAGDRVVWDKRKGRPFLRFISNDMTQLKLLSTYLKPIGIYPIHKRKLSWYLRCYDDDLILAYEHLCESSLPFRPTLDFVRGYIDTHSHFHISTPGYTCLTLTGWLVPQCHDFLVGLGAINNKVYHQSIGTPRMNLHTKSLRKIRETLYPPGCVCNEEVRARLYRV